MVSNSWQKQSKIRRLNGFTKNRSFSRFTYRLWKESHLLASYLFSRRRFEYISTSFCHRFAISVTFRFTWQTLQTSLQLLSFWTVFFSRFPTSGGLQILKFIFSRKTTKTRNTRTHWRLQILSRTKWRDSDWIILTGRHSTVDWVLHSWLEGGIKKTIASLQASPAAILPRPVFSRFTRSSFLFPSPSDACHAGYFQSNAHCFSKLAFNIYDFYALSIKKMARISL